MRCQLRNVRLPIALLVLAAFAAACDRAPDPGDQVGFDPVVDFDSGAVSIETESDTFDLTVDIAESNEQRAYGMMERASLPEDAGIIFLYPQPQGPEGTFYMWRVLIPLDIAFIDEEGVIVGVKGMVPCGNLNPDVCPRYEAGVPYASALEVNRHFFERNAIGIGDRVVLQRAGEDATPASDR